MEYGYTQNLYKVKPDPKIKWCKLLHRLKNYFKYFLKGGGGQTPATFIPPA